MSTPQWDLFAAVVVLATLALLVLSRASARAITGVEGTGGPTQPHEEWPAEPVPPRSRPSIPGGTALLANVALTHGLLGVSVVALAWYAEIPFAALGLGPLTAGSIGVGVALGLVLYAGSEAATALADRAGIAYDERLRELLAPDGPRGWVLLLLVVLPVVAGAEELLFRGALIGALGAGYGLPLPALVVASSVLFGLGHSAQGWIGVVATAVMGLVLGTAFVLTGSLAAVVVAHYAVDAMEFVVREGLLD